MKPYVDPQWAWEAFRPTDANPWNTHKVAHLFRRAGFGLTSTELSNSIASGLSETVHGLVHESGESEAFQRDMQAMTRSLVASSDPANLSSGWLYRMLKSTDQLREKLTLFWHGHFATSAEKVADAFMMQQQNSMLRQHSLGNFHDLAQGISKDPAMLLYLDSATNRKTHPNENFARELMELFCLGEGNYTEADIRELSRCFTGWEVRNRAYRFNRYQHDFNEKSFLGASKAFSGEEAVTHVIAQKSAPKFIARKLVQYLVMDEPLADDKLIEPLAKQLEEDGFEILRTIERILHSNLFFSEHSYARKIKSPVEMAIGLMRSLDINTKLPDLHRTLGEVGQAVFYPPNVKGWEGGRIWINSSTLLGRSNLIHSLLTTPNTTFGGEDLSGLLASRDVHTMQQAFDHFEQLLFAVPLGSRVKQQILSAHQAAPSDESFLNLLHQLATLPQFQLS